MKKNGDRKKPQDYRDGRKVTGKGTGTSDSILALLSDEEYVLPEESVKMVGVPALDALRDAGLAQRYANGGIVAPGRGMVPKGLAELSAEAMGMGTGVLGLAKGMTHSDPAQAAVMDVTRTREYQDALRGSRGAGGNTPTPGLLGMTAGPWAGETPNETLARLYQQQAQNDEMVRRATGGPSPTENRMLMQGNQWTPRAFPKGYADGGLVTGYGYIDDEQRKALNREFGRSVSDGMNRLDASLKSAAPPVQNTSPAYGVGATPRPENPVAILPRGSMPEPSAAAPSNSPQPYSLQSMLPAPSTGFQPPPGQGYSALGESGVFGRSTTLQPGTAGYQDAQRQRLGGGPGSFAGGSQPLYDRGYMGPAGAAVGFSSVAPGNGTLSVADQGNGGTVEGNVAAINRQIAALQDLNQARMDDPYNGRFSFGEGTRNPFSLPGDSFQDSRGRAAQFAQLMSDATSGTRREREGASRGLQSLMNLMQGNQQQSLGLAGIEQRQQANAIDSRNQQAQAYAQQQQLQQQSQADAQRYGLDLGRFGLDLANATQKAVDNANTPPTVNQLQAGLISRILEARARNDTVTEQSLLSQYQQLGFSRQPDGLPMSGQL